MFLNNKTATTLVACVLAFSLGYCRASVAAPPATVTPLHQIQGTSFLSPLNNMVVMTEGVVTARLQDGYYIQTIFGSDDGNALTSQGLFVFTDTAPGANITTGSLVRVIGTVEEYRPASDPHQLSFTRLTSISSTAIISTANALPSAITLIEADLNDGNSIDHMERYEGMRVRVSQLKVTQPVGGQLNEVTGVTTLDGVFYGVLPSTMRPIREPGIAITDTTPIPSSKSITFFDTNPEGIRIDSSRLTGTAALSPDVDDVINGALGILEYKNGKPSLLLLPNASTSISLGSGSFGLRGPFYEEISVATFNLDRFFDNVDSPGINEPILTSATYQNRLTKTANMICSYVFAPDVLAVYEIENINALQQLADKINNNTELCQTQPAYTAHMIESNDPKGLDIGLLVSEALLPNNKKQIEILSISQIENNKTFLNASGTTERLYDRPSLLVKIRANHENNNVVDMTIIISDFMSNNNINSLNSGANGWATIGDYTRKKRAAQALSLAQFIKNRQVADANEKLILLGNFNANAANDGYVDVMGILTGLEASNANVLEYINSPIDQALTNLSNIARLPYEVMNAPTDQQTSIANGDAQRLDHIVLNQNAFSHFKTIWGVSGANARFGMDLFYDQSVPVKASRYEPTVAYLTSDLFRSIDLTAYASTSPSFAVSGSTNEFYVSSLNNVDYYFFLGNEGKSGAKNAFVTISSDLTPGQWNLIYNSSPDITACSDITATANGSKIDCSVTEVPANTPAFVELRFGIPANASLTNKDIEIQASVSHSGGGNDLAPANNIDSKIMKFTDAVDLAMEPNPHLNLIEPGSNLFVSFSISSIGLNPPGAVTVEMTANTAIGKATVQINNLNNPGGDWNCNTGILQSNGTTKWTCSNENYTPVNGFALLYLSTSDDGDGGKTYRTDTRVISSKMDINLLNNTASTTINVKDDTELSIQASKLVNRTIKLYEGGAYFTFSASNMYPSIARNPRIELIFNVPYTDVSPGTGGNYFASTNGSANQWICSAATPFNVNESRVICTSNPNNLRTTTASDSNWRFDALIATRARSGAAFYTITATAKFYSDSVDLDLTNNTSTISQTVDSSTDVIVLLATNGQGNESPVTEPNSILFSVGPYYQIFDANIPQNVRLNYQLNALVGPLDLIITEYQSPTNEAIKHNCQFNQNTTNNTTDIICPKTIGFYLNRITLSLATSPAMVGKTYRLTATATNDLFDTNLSNNTINVDVAVVAKTNNCIALNKTCNGGNASLPIKAISGNNVALRAYYQNYGPSTAKTTKVKITAAVPAANLSTNNALCGSAVAGSSAGESEFTCSIGDFLGNGVIEVIDFSINTAGLNPDATITYSARIDSPTEDTDSSNNLATDTIRVVPDIDLSTQVVVKGAEDVYNKQHDFYIFSKATGNNINGAKSELNIAVDAPYALSAPTVHGIGWNCYNVSGTPVNWKLNCQPIVPITNSSTDRLVLSFRPASIQRGQDIKVTAEHVYLPNALAGDRNTSNNTSSATRRITSQRTMDDEVNTATPVLNIVTPTTGLNLIPIKPKPIKPIRKPLRTINRQTQRKPIARRVNQ
jgi:predicted extracellular nuclease